MKVDYLNTVHIDGILMNNFTTMCLLITSFLLDARLVGHLSFT